MWRTETTRKLPLPVSRCPTCEGHGVVPQGFYSYPAGQSFGATNTSTEGCRACKGSGLVRVLYDGSVEPAKLKDSA